MLGIFRRKRARLVFPDNPDLERIINTRMQSTSFGLFVGRIVDKDYPEYIDRNKLKKHRTIEGFEVPIV